MQMKFIVIVGNFHNSVVLVDVVFVVFVVNDVVVVFIVVIAVFIVVIVIVIILSVVVVIVVVIAVVVMAYREKRFEFDSADDFGVSGLLGGRQLLLQGGDLSLNGKEKRMNELMNK